MLAGQGWPRPRWPRVHRSEPHEPPFLGSLWHAAGALAGDAEGGRLRRAAVRPDRAAQAARSYKTAIPPTGSLEFSHSRSCSTSAAINFARKFNLIKEQWTPKVIAEMNDYQFKLVKIQGEFVWHSHADTDETFIVIDGELRIDLRDGAVTLAAGNGGGAARRRTQAPCRARSLRPADRAARCAIPATRKGADRAKRCGSRRERRAGGDALARAGGAPRVVRRWKSAGKVRSAPARCPVGDESEAGLTPSVEQFVPTRTCVSDGSCHVPDGRIRPHRTLYLPVEGNILMSNAYIDALKKRRTQYALGRNLSCPEELIALVRTRSSTALVVQLAKLARAGAVRRRKREALGSGHRSRAQGRPGRRLRQDRSQLKSFAAGAGTILFFEDQDVVRSLQEKFALYADNFPVWSEQAGGMAQLSVWAALANAGVGASLQHYNPLVDADVARGGTFPPAGSCARRCRSARTKPASAKRPSWTTPSVSAWPAKQAGHAPRWPGLKPAPVSTKTARVLFWARSLALRTARPAWGTARPARSGRQIGEIDQPERQQAQSCVIISQRAPAGLPAVCQ